MDFPFFSRRTLDEFFDGLINCAKYFEGDEDELHDMGRDTAKGGFNKYSPTNHVEEFNLPPKKSNV